MIIKFDNGILDAYKYYRTNSVLKVKVTRATYSQILRDVNLDIMDLMIKDSFEFRMPHKLGYLRVKKFKTSIKIKDGKLVKNKMPIDWKKTWDYWQKLFPGKTKSEIKGIKGKILVKSLNTHTDGYSMKWYWDKNTCIVRNKSVYMFKAVRGGVKNDKYYGKTGLSHWINSEDRINDYLL